MSLLTVDVGGASETIIAFQRAGHAEPRTVGARRYAFAGNERSMIRAEPFIVPVLLANLAASTTRTLRTLFAEQAQVVCAGDVFNNGGVPVLCSGEITDEMEVGGAYWIPTLTLRQVTASTRGVLQMSVSPAGVATPSATMIGTRRFTVGPSGSATTTATLRAKYRVTTSAAGRATTAVTLNAKRSVSTAASGVASTTATGTKIP
jgi:hypothetical protein